MLEIVNYSPVRTDDLAETKLRIAQTLEQELRASNTNITQVCRSKLSVVLQSFSQNEINKIVLSLVRIICILS